MKILKILLWALMPIVMFTMMVPEAAGASDVILNPGTLSGSVSLTGYDITSITVRAIDTNKNYSATITVSVPAGASSIGYTLTVEGDNDYYVVADVFASVPSVPDTVRALIPPTSPVNVPIGVDIPLDLSMEPAIISGTVSTGSSANTITQYTVYAFILLPEFETSNYSYTNTGILSVPGDPGRDYTLLVAPETEYYNVRAHITIDGLNYIIYDYNVLTLAAGVTLVRDYIIDVTSATISGFALLQGIDVYYAHIYGNASSPTRNANFTIPDVTTGLYTLAVDAGAWRIYPRFNFNLPDADPDLAGLTGYLQLPYSPIINVSAGDDPNINFDIVPGFIPGTLNLWGANTNYSSGQTRAYGHPNGGYANSQINPDTGKFLFVCFPGDFQTDYYQYLYFDYPDDPDTFLRSNVNQNYWNNANLQTISAGETAEPVELTYGTITVRRYFYVAGDGILSSPYIRATRSEQPYSTAYGYGSPAATTEGQAIVTLLLPGSYSLEAFATVDGSVTEFGTVIIVVDEGDVVVIGGTARPTIIVTNPTNGEIICGNRVTVEGTATDDVGVASITINGEDVAFASTGNPDDPNEVGFSHEITLNIDEANTITVIVSDVDQTDPTTLTMTVFSESCGADVIECAVDIKPGSCPNPLNVKSNGVFSVAILGTNDFDVRTIDLDTVRLLGVAPVRSANEDVGTPFYPFIGKEDKLDCTEEGADGIEDLALKFDRQQIVQAIETSGEEVVDGKIMTLPLTGNLLVEFGGNEINGEDVIIILKKGK